MQFSGNFKGKTLFWVNFGLRSPLGVKTPLDRPDPNPGSVPGALKDPSWSAVEIPQVWATSATQTRTMLSDPLTVFLIALSGHAPFRSKLCIPTFPIHLHFNQKCLLKKYPAFSTTNSCTQSIPALKSPLSTMQNAVHATIPQWATLIWRQWLEIFFSSQKKRNAFQKELTLIKFRM